MNKKKSRPEKDGSFSCLCTAAVGGMFTGTSGRSGPDLRQVKAPVEQAPQLDLQDLIRQLQESPELAQALAGIISAGGGQRCDKGDDEAEPANSAISKKRFLLAE